MRTLRRQHTPCAIRKPTRDLQHPPDHATKQSEHPPRMRSKTERPISRNATTQATKQSSTNRSRNQPKHTRQNAPFVVTNHPENHPPTLAFTTNHRNETKPPATRATRLHSTNLPIHLPPTNPTSTIQQRTNPDPARQPLTLSAKTNSPAIPMTVLVPTGMLLLLLAGILTRSAAFRFPEILSQTSGIVLFLPAALGTIWLGWRPDIRPKEAALVALLILPAAFLCWNGVMLYGLPAKAWPQAIYYNALHWLLFLLTGTIACKYSQWLTSTAILKGQTRGDREKPYQLTIFKLLVLFVVTALGMIVIQSATSSGYGPSSARLSISPILRNTFTTAVLGGLLTPIHWTILFLLRYLRSYRLAAAILWIPILAGLRWAIQESLAVPAVAFPGTDALQSDLLDGESLLWTLQDFRRLGESPKHTVRHFLDAATQIAMSLMAMRCFTLAGYRCVIDHLEKRRGTE